MALQFLWEEGSVCGVLCLSVPENMNLEGVGVREEFIVGTRGGLGQTSGVRHIRGGLYHR